MAKDDNALPNAAPGLDTASPDDADDDVVDLLEVVKPGKPVAKQAGDDEDFSADLDSMLDTLSRAEAAKAAEESEGTPFPDPTPVDHEVDHNERLDMPGMDDIDDILTSLGASPDSAKAPADSEDDDLLADLPDMADLDALPAVGKATGLPDEDAPATRASGAIDPLAALDPAELDALLDGDDEPAVTTDNLDAILAATTAPDPVPAQTQPDPLVEPLAASGHGQEIPMDLEGLPPEVMESLAPASPVSAAPGGPNALDGPDLFDLAEEPDALLAPELPDEPDQDDKDTELFEAMLNGTDLPGDDAPDALPDIADALPDMADDELLAAPAHPQAEPEPLDDPDMVASPAIEESATEALLRDFAAKDAQADDLLPEAATEPVLLEDLEELLDTAAGDIASEALDPLADAPTAVESLTVTREVTESVTLAVEDTEADTAASLLPGDQDAAAGIMEELREDALPEPLAPDLGQTDAQSLLTGQDPIQAAPEPLQEAAGPAGQEDVVAQLAEEQLQPEPAASADQGRFDEVDLNELDALLDDMLATAPASGPAPAISEPPAPPSLPAPADEDRIPESLHAAMTAEIATLRQDLEALRSTLAEARPAQDVSGASSLPFEPERDEQLDELTQVASTLGDRLLLLEHQFANLTANLDKLAAEAAARVIREELVALMEAGE